MSFIEELSSRGISGRRYQKSDLHTLAPLINEAYAYQRPGEDYSRIDEAELAKRAKISELYAIQSDDVMVGCVYLQVSDRTLEFGLLALDANTRGKGMGRKIVESIIAYADGVGFQYVSLRYMSTAIWLKKFYESFGFEETKDIYSVNGFDLVGMRKKIEGVVMSSDFKIGDHVGWQWGNGIAEGVVVEVRPETTTIETKGKSITRNGNEEDPAIVIEQKNGTRVLKLAREIQKTTD